MNEKKKTCQKSECQTCEVICQKNPNMLKVQSDSTSTEMKSIILTKKVQQRVKELECLHSISKIIEKDEDLESSLQQIVHILPQAWQYPEKAVAKLKYKSQSFLSEHYQQSQWQMGAEITVYHKKIGQVTIGYLKKSPEFDEGPFLKEERNLLNTIAEQISGFLDKNEAEEKLRKSEDKYQMLFENVSDAIFVYGIDENGDPTCFIEVNKTACDRLNYSREELLHLKPEDIDSSHERVEMHSIIEELKKEKQVIFEGTHISKLNQIFPVEINAKLIDYKGSPAIISLARDINERKLLETAREIATRERLYDVLSSKMKGIFQALPDLYFKVDYDGNVCDSYANDYSKYQLDDSHFRNNKIFEVLPEIAISKLERGLKDLQTTQSLVTIEFYAIIQGRKQYFEARMVPYEEEHVIILVRDITQRVEASLALKFEQKQLLSIFDSIDANIRIIDPKTYQILFINKFGQALFPQKLVGGTCYKELHNLTRPCSWCPNAALMNSKGNTHSREFHDEVTHKDFLTNEKIIKWVDGRDVKLEFGFDITNHKKLESQLLQSQKMEAIGNLAGGIAHDFNNVLMAIQGNLDLIGMIFEEENPVKEEIDEMLKTVQSGSSLTRHLLAFSRKRSIKPEILQINEIISEIYKMLCRLIPTRIQLTIDLDSNITQIKAEKSQIERIILNLVVNARDAISETNFKNERNCIHIKTSMAKFDNIVEHDSVVIPSGNYVVISVSDTGIGMDPKTKERIFEPFFTTKKLGKGTGMGLTTVYGIVEQNNAYIHVYSEIHQGTTFKIYWPTGNFEKDENQLTEASIEDLTGTETVIIAEDTDQIRNSTSKYLKSLGYNIQEAENGIEAFKIIKSSKKRVDLLITDITMPQMDGLELGALVKKFYPYIKILYVSGNFEDKNRIKNSARIEGNYLEKPYSLMTLAKAIRTLVE